MKVMTIVGTRPELIKLSCVIKKLDRELDTHILVHTGQNYDYELNAVFFEDLGLRKPDVFLNIQAKHCVDTVAQVMTKSYELMQEYEPDALLIYGDTNSCLGAYSAKRLKIPVFHMEAGNRCFDERVPEEINRRVLDHISDINMTITEHARRYLIDEGIKPETIFKIGSSMHEVIDEHRDNIQESTVLTRLNLLHGEYMLVSCHREENVDSEDNFTDFMNSLNDLAEMYNVPIIVSTHPRTANKVCNFKYFVHKLIQFEKPFGFHDYLKLQQNAMCVISDSGTITEEASILRIPAVTIRQSHERPEGMDEGILIMSGLDPAHVTKCVGIAMRNKTNGQVSDYETFDVSKKVLKIIMSYTQYIKQTVWRQYD